MRAQITHIRNRRRLLRKAIDYQANFELWEESCVPSYCHPNPLAAYISWSRLFAAVEMAERTEPSAKRVLDFGSSVGELGQLISDQVQYDFVEEHDPAAALLLQQLPRSKRTSLQAAPVAAYDQIFAIDSLEHNTDFRQLLGVLVTKMAPDGVLILSGPTENRLYKLGRRIAGFEGHYHETNIHAIEAAAAESLTRISVKTILPVAPLFRVTAWRRQRV